MADTNFSNEQMLKLYESMLRIRKVEEQLAKDSKEGNIPGAVHLYIGQEAVAVGVCSQLSDKDWIASTHRGHGHFLAKGGETRLLMAEVYGRDTGICRGRGGSMHVADFSKGIIGANGIVGGGISITTGAGLASKLANDGSVAVVFFGDGAANQGVLAEALNISTLWQLPVIFVCENNGFSEFSPTNTVTAGNIVDRAKPYGTACETVDGNDVIAVWQCAERAKLRALRGDGPTLIEAHTYRQRGHVEAEATFLSKKYRDSQEIENWVSKDPITLFEKRIVDAGQAKIEDLQIITKAIEAEVNEAIEFAEKSPYPDPGGNEQQYMFT